MNVISTHLTLDEAAKVAAHLASEAVTELLRYVREGDHAPATAFADEIVQKLAEALVHTLGIDGDGIFDAVEHPEHHAREVALRQALRTACFAYVEETPA